MEIFTKPHRHYITEVKGQGIEVFSCNNGIEWWGIVYLVDPDSYAVWRIYTPCRTQKSDRLNGRGQTG